MSDILEDDLDEPQEDVTEDQPQDTSEPETYEQRTERVARARGWTPKEEWTGDPEEWADPLLSLIHI